MQVRSSRDPFQTPEQLDRRFSLVAGVYVAALLSPALLLIVVQRLQVVSWPATLGSLGAVGAVLTVTVTWIVSRQGELVAWFDSVWIAVLIPAVGILPMGLYSFHSLLFVAFAVTDLQADSAANLVGFIGFLLGVVATTLGGYLVLMARTQLANATVDDADIAVEWRAGWPQRARLKLMVGTLAVVGLLAGLAVWQLGWRAATTVLPGGIVPVFMLSSMVTERTYRATSAGLEQRREGQWFASRRLIPWSRFESFSVTNNAIVLHRTVPYIDIRCRRYLIDDEAVIAALEDYLERQGS
ncbi:hypothetical protein [Haloarcula argentinensis]|uniref:DUF5673 domain-containing protein n=1 Tax=Haloarcula argentinensis TaxID=43776 RepID=A0ABU2F4K2_HALAR|nr:hypothetical protein [Haloarcula argentinensis]EMA26306.1 hypothetical protein C443_01122 [Haloarcula argentinensis DSM 12282]MDS0255487.1 hypothetical protein [Haloarcula argentinensis]